jgi:hypothetical protein
MRSAPSEASGGIAMIGRDLRFAFRRLRLTPTFTVAATVTMAIAICATASVFAVVDGVLLKGVGVAWLLTRALAALFLGVNPHDVRIFIGAPAVFAIVALAAAIAPSWRATRVSPVTVLSST